MVHSQHGYEDRARRVGAPNDGDDTREISERVVDAHTHTDTAEADHGDEAVPEDGGRAISVDAGLGHEVEEEVDGRGAEQADAVDVRKLGFTRLARTSAIKWRKGCWEMRTHEEEDESKGKAEDERSCKVGVVHDVRVDSRQRVEDRQALLEYMRGVDPQFYSPA